MLEYPMIVYDVPKWTVYEHITPSGKKYIGITGQVPKVRWQNGHGYERNPHMWAAIQKYGWNNIEHKILFSGLTKKAADIYEIEFIAVCQTTDRKYGYNMQKGGRYGLAKSCYTDTIRKRMSESRTGKRMGRDNFKSKQVVCLNTGKHYDSILQAQKDTGINPSDIRECCVGNYQFAGMINNERAKWMFEEEYELIDSDELKNKLNQLVKITNSKKVICLNNQTVFNSANDAADFYKMSFSSGITKCCTYVRNSCGTDECGENLKWMYADEFLQLSDEEKQKALSFKRTKRKLSRPTKVICLNTLEVFDTCKQAMKFTASKNGKQMMQKIAERVPYTRHPITKEPLYWDTYNHYIQLKENEKEELKNQFYTGSFLMPKKEAII